MNNETTIVNRFYEAFSKRDFRTMNDCYSDDIVFFDPVFQLIKGDQVKKMWDMLCRQAKDFELSYQNPVAIDHEYITCEWEATYTFSKTGKKVVNKVKAFMRIADGKIIEHSDGFSLHKWSMQAMGFSGWLLGWNRFYQHRIQQGAREKLLKYIQTSS